MGMHDPASRDVLGLTLDVVNEQRFFAFVDRAIHDCRKVWIGNLNVHAVNLAIDEPLLKKVFNAADLVFCDGQGLSIVLRMLGLGYFPQFTYNRMLPAFFRFCADRGYRFYFLGSEDDVIHEAMAKANKAHPGLVAGCHHGFFSDAELPAILDGINHSGAHILLLGMGMPKQERFIVDHRDHLNVNVFLNGGGCFMFYANRHPVAPLWLSRIGMEWVYRLWHEPRRLARRYLVGNPKFLFRVIRWRLAGRQSVSEGRDCGG